MWDVPAPLASFIRALNELTHSKLNNMFDQMSFLAVLDISKTDAIFSKEPKL